MRDIKFRAWDVQNKQMIFDGIEYELKVLASPMNGRDPIIGFNDDPEYFRLMQYTGLKDMNGVEIFEGDILQGDFPLLVVGYHIESASFACSKTPDFTQVQDLYWFFNDANPKEFEVIGNVHQHHHLLNKTV